MFLTYKEYEKLGGLIEDEDLYKRLEAKARAHINRLTFGRIAGAQTVSDAVKYCTMDLIAALAADEDFGAMASGRSIASMNNDGVSITFASNGGAAASRFNAIIKTWLASETTPCGIPLLYAGVGVS